MSIYTCEHTQLFNGAMIPCKKCINCLIRRQMSWTLRMCLELQDHKYGAFTTLTYENAANPENELTYPHIQDFLKRLRKLNHEPVRYFCCGEFGKRTQRAHWHLCLFGTNPLDMEASLTELWPHGLTHTGTLTPASMAYTARYALKSAGSKDQVNMSRRPGLGLSRLKKTAKYLALNTPYCASMPGLIRYQNKVYPLDGYAYKIFKEHYLLNGGLIEEKYESAAKQHMLQHANAILGDQFRIIDIKEGQFVTADKSEIEQNRIANARRYASKEQNYATF